MRLIECQVSVLGYLVLVVWPLSNVMIIQHYEEQVGLGVQERRQRSERKSEDVSSAAENVGLNDNDTALERHPGTSCIAKHLNWAATVASACGWAVPSDQSCQLWSGYINLKVPLKRALSSLYIFKSVDVGGPTEAFHLGGYRDSTRRINQFISTCWCFTSVSLLLRFGGI